MLEIGKEEKYLVIYKIGYLPLITEVVNKPTLDYLRGVGEIVKCEKIGGFHSSDVMYG